MSSKNTQQNPTESAGVFQDVINSIFQPGVNHGVMVVMNCAFLCLFVILGYLLFATRLNIHVCALTIIAGLLFASIQWFVMEMAASQRNKSPSSPSSPTPSRASTSNKNDGANKNKNKKKKL
ncbi:hypothetical protein COEREDRAFT_80923 [Coemansia reversa NRRL 1564]|uniref:Pkr1-domain-containing protein n=1 Tax=Coemansia reversa (strain ATCC 12441 / NRRL 1564) TaxID=763665 RepID=A0A2G5BCX5_COERN|nr:hypothetical protein COEREDRAFT_80923 [Coemansia reversa NRRL 1564]|eukprot:PIA16868.1 hypothetical protein COEREDRAFT_80923 [Coemansia reversa NRRL 1564]